MGHERFGSAEVIGRGGSPRVNNRYVPRRMTKPLDNRVQRDIVGVRNGRKRWTQGFKALLRQMT